MVNNQENRPVPRKDHCQCRLQEIHQRLVFPQGPGPGHGLVEVAVEDEIS